MAITRVGTASNSGSGTSVIVDLSGIGIASGDLILLIHGWEAQTDGVPAVITSGYTDLIADQFVNDTRDTNAAVSYKFADGSETQVEVAGVNSIVDQGGALVTVYRGVDPTTPFDVTTVTAAGTNGNAINPNAITPSTSGAKIVLLGIATSSISGITGPTAAPTGFGNLATVASPGANRGYYACTADADWAGGTVDPDSFTGQTTSTTSDSWFVATIALRPATGAITLSADALSATGMGGAVSFVGSKTISAGAIAASGVGGDVSLLIGRSLSAGALTATGAGGSAAITAGRIVGAGALSASASGGSVALVIGRVISAGPLAATGSGGAIADLAGSITLSAGALAASAAGHDASLLVGRVTLAAPLAAIGTGGVVALRVGRVLVAGRGSATGFGGAVTLVASGASSRRYARPGEPNGVRLLITGNSIAGFGG